MKTYFDHEKLHVYQNAIQFVAWLEPLLRTPSVDSALKDQINRASMSICLNIAEGNGKQNAKDRGRFFQMARGSALECAACLDLLGVKKQVSPELIENGKEMLSPIVSMLFGLIGSTRYQVSEEEAEYGDQNGLLNQARVPGEHDRD